MVKVESWSSSQHAIKVLRKVLDRAEALVSAGGASHIVTFGVSVRIVGFDDLFTNHGFGVYSALGEIFNDLRCIKEEFSTSAIVSIIATHHREIERGEIVEI
jgi:hypothetical protein